MYNPEAAYELLPWIDAAHLDCSRLAGNPRAGGFLAAHPEKVRYNRALAANPSAHALLAASPEKLGWGWTSANPRVLELLALNAFAPESHGAAYLHSTSSGVAQEDTPGAREEANAFRVDWKALSRNPGAIPLLAANPDRIYWRELSSNPGKGVNAVFDLSPSNLDWASLSANPMAVLWAANNPDKVCYKGLSANPSVSAPPLLRRHIARLDWAALSGNPAALRLLEAEPDKIDWAALSGNPGIFREKLGGEKNIESTLDSLVLAE